MTGLRNRSNDTFDFRCLENADGVSLDCRCRSGGYAVINYKMIDMHGLYGRHRLLPISWVNVIQKYIPPEA